MQNIYWKELGLLVAVWAVVLALQIAKVTVCFVFIFLHWMQLMKFLYVLATELRSHLFSGILGIKLFTGTIIIELNWKEEFAHLSRSLFAFFFSCLSDPCCWSSECIRGNSPVQRASKDCIKGRCTHKMEGTPACALLCLWYNGWGGWWTTWSWWRFHFKPSFLGARNPSSGSQFLLPERKLKKLFEAYHQHELTHPCPRNLFSVPCRFQVPQPSLSWHLPHQYPL